MSNSKYCSNWTEGSIFCYRRGCNCQGCEMNDLIETRCQMKRAVFELVRKFGKPPEYEEKGLSISQQKIINAIIAGCNNKIEIAGYTGLTVTNVQSALSDMYEMAKFDGVAYKNLRYKLPEFIKWVRRGNDNV